MGLSTMRKINVQIDTGTDWHETCSCRLLINPDYTMSVASSLLLRPTELNVKVPLVKCNILTLCFIPNPSRSSSGASGHN